LDHLLEQLINMIGHTYANRTEQMQYLRELGHEGISCKTSCVCLFNGELLEQDVVIRLYLHEWGVAGLIHAGTTVFC
jgi:hypothetical protein